MRIDIELLGEMEVSAEDRARMDAARKELIRRILTQKMKGEKMNKRKKFEWIKKRIVRCEFCGTVSDSCKCPECGMYSYHVDTPEDDSEETAVYYDDEEAAR